MKKALLLFLSFLTISFTLISCSKDDDNPELANYYSVGDIKVTNFPHANYMFYEDSQSGDTMYAFALASDEIDNSPEELLVIAFPGELIGKKIDLSSTYSSFRPFFSIRSNNKYIDADELTGTDNWIKVTKNSEDNFTIEISAEVDNKPVKGYYKGKFISTDLRL